MSTALAVPLIFPGPTAPDNLTVVNETVFFTVNNFSSGGELWKSDGTTEGTVQLKTFPPIFCPICLAEGTAPAVPLFFGGGGPFHLTNVNGTLFFTADDGIHGTELWKSDGTPEGTVLVKDINPDLIFIDHAATVPSIVIFPFFRRGSFPSNLTAVGDTLFFSALTQDNGVELWKSDGTEEGTVLVRDIYPGAFPFPLAGTAPIIAPPTPHSSSPFNLINNNGTLFFTAFHPDTGTELYRSDGTEEGTLLVNDINPGSASSAPANLTVVGETLFFAATTPDTGRELWRSDGTEEGTALVVDLNPGTASAFSPGGVVEFLVNVNGVLFFTASTPDTGRELWRSDGTDIGTALVRDINPGSGNGFVSSVTFPVVVDGILYFAANDGQSGSELWRSDGTEAGTYLVADITPGAAGSSLLYLTAVGSTLFFSTFTPELGFELWRSDGTAEGTVLVLDILPGSDSSFPTSLIEFGGVLFFGGLTPSGGGLYRSDGTADGTVLVREFPAPPFFVVPL